MVIQVFEAESETSDTSFVGLLSVSGEKETVLKNLMNTSIFILFSGLKFFTKKQLVAFSHAH